MAKIAQMAGIGEVEGNRGATLAGRGGKFLQFWRRWINLQVMTDPLALVVYERLLPGTQLVNRLQDLKFRAQTISDPGLLVGCAEQTRPLVVLVDLDSTRTDLLGVIAQLKAHAATQHLPVIAFAAEITPEMQKKAEGAGVTLLANESAILSQLPQLLEQALQVE